MNEIVLPEEQLDVMPGDLDELGQLKPYHPPLFDLVYTEEELAQPTPELESLLTVAEPDEALDDRSDDEKAEGIQAFGTIAPSNHAHRASWMGTYRTVSNMRVEDLILPGTHNSGFDKQAPRSPSSETCQDVSPHTQLHNGIRVLDLRVQFFSGYPRGDARRFGIFHLTLSGRTVEGDIIAAVHNLHRAYPREVVILDFHEFKNFTTPAHQELNGIIKKAFGARLIAPNLKNLLLTQLWDLKKNTVIAYNASPRDGLFWPGVNQMWIGSDTPSNNQLRDFVRKTGEKPKPPGELRAVQAAKYSLPFFVPKDISKELMSWFAANNAASPIMNHRIINTDWSLRNKLVDNCIYSNQFRNDRQRCLNASPNTHPFIPGHINRVAYSIYNGNWKSVIDLPIFKTDGVHYFTLASDAEWEATLNLKCDDGFRSVPISNGDRMALERQTGQNWRVLCETFTPNKNGKIVPLAPGEKFCRYTLGDGDWLDVIELPANAPHNSVILIDCRAAWSTKLRGHNIEGGDQQIHQNERHAYIYKQDQRRWSRLPN